MTFKKGDIVAAPNSCMMMQVLSSNSNNDTTICMMVLSNRMKHTIELPSDDLVRASVN